MTDPEATFAALVLFVLAIFALSASRRTFYLVGAVVMVIFAIGLSL